MPDPNNILIEPDRLCFQMICKAGNTSMKRMLCDKFISDTNDRKSAYRKPQNFFPFCHKNDIPKDYLVVGFCRHPVARIKSCYLNKIKENFHLGFEKRHSGMFSEDMSFDEFIEVVHKIPDGEGDLCDQHFRSQTFDLNLSRLDYLIRMEHILWEWSRVQVMIWNHCGKDYPNFYHSNKSKTNPEIQISEYTMKLIRERYAEDFKLLNYS
jgi:hypothetical protein